VAGRPRAEAWHFITEQRVGRELWLITPERVVVARERLAERLGDRGHIFDTAHDYRRAVDERLFHMGEERYRALMDTLITLRHPQLSRRPDEQNLSKALTEALSPMPQATLEDVAEAMTQLDEYRDALAAHEALRDAVAQFGRRYRVYARIQARRQARVLRQAQTEFDNASRALADARSEHALAEKAVAAHSGRHAELERKLARDRAALDELRQDPVMRDARRLHEAVHAARERARDAEEARSRRAEAEERHRREQAATKIRQDEVERTLASLTREVEVAEQLAATLGVAADHARSAAPLSPFGELGHRSPEELDRVHLELREVWQSRGRHFAQIRERLSEVDRAAAARDLAASARNDRAETFQAAQERARTADAQLRRGAELFLQQWQIYLGRLAVLTVSDPESAMDALSAWTESQIGDNPMLDLLRQAQQDAAGRLANNEANLKRQQGELRETTDDLVAERERLAKGEDRTPPRPHTRSAEARQDRDGAPLWRLVEFRDQVPASARAGLEAALEAAGLLDAWVLPDATVLDPHTHDVLLTARAARQTSLRDWLIPADGSSVSRETIETVLAGIDCTSEDPGDAEAWVSPSGRFRLGPARGAWSKADAEYVGFAAREAARRRRLEQIGLELASLTADLEKIQAALQALESERRALNDDFAQAPSDSGLRDAHAQFSAAELHRREAQERLARADAQWNQAEDAWRRAHGALERDAQDLRLPADAPALATLELRLAEYPQSALTLVQAARSHRRALSELREQDSRERDAQTQATAAREDHERRIRGAEEAEARRDELRAGVGAAVAEIERRLARKAEAVQSGEKLVAKENEALATAREDRAKSEQKAKDTQQALEERSLRRQEAVEKLRAFAQTGLLSAALPDLEVPDPAGGWTIDPALGTARRAEQALADVASEDADWTRIQSDISRDLTTLTTAMSAQGHQAQAETSDFGLIVEIVYQSRPERPDVLERRLETEIAERREILTARERAVLENHLQAEVAAGLQRLLQDARRRVDNINAELERRPTSIGVRFKLEWQPLPEGEEGAPVGLAAARGRLLNTAADAWSAEDRRLVGEFLHNRIKTERSRDDGGALLDHLSRALDYRRWHRFRVKRYQDGAWRPLSGPASSGERALGLTVPLFAAASSHYASAEYPYAPRLVLLDEAFAGIDDEARAHCMALIREFDLDFVMTSEREWGCYAELPGLAICNLVRREGVDAVFVSRWRWDGRARLEEADPSRRFPEPAIAST
jgi:uncharacterized protein (TIGR02680 family)